MAEGATNPRDTSTWLKESASSSPLLPSPDHEIVTKKKKEHPRCVKPQCNGFSLRHKRASTSTQLRCGALLPSTMTFRRPIDLNTIIRGTESQQCHGHPGSTELPEGVEAQHETVQECGVLQIGPRTNLWVPNKCRGRRKWCNRMGKVGSRHHCSNQD